MNGKSKHGVLVINLPPEMSEDDFIHTFDRAGGIDTIGFTSTAYESHGLIVYYSQDGKENALIMDRIIMQDKIVRIIPGNAEDFGLTLEDMMGKKGEQYALVEAQSINYEFEFPIMTFSLERINSAASIILLALCAVFINQIFK